jgi:hypothetical protein
VTAALEVEKTASQLLGILQGEDHWRACNQCRKAALTKASESVESLSTEKLFLTTQVEKQSAETHGQREEIETFTQPKRRWRQWPKRPPTQAEKKELSDEKFDALDKIQLT